MTIINHEQGQGNARRHLAAVDDADGEIGMGDAAIPVLRMMETVTRIGAVPHAKQVEIIRIGQQVGLRPARALFSESMWEDGDSALSDRHLRDITSAQTGAVQITPSAIPSGVLAKVPLATCEHYNVVPVSEDATGLTIASATTLIGADLDAIQSVVGVRVNPVRAPSDQIAAVLDRKRSAAIAEDSDQIGETEDTRRAKSAETWEELVGGGTAAAAAVRSSLTEAVARDASDIHIAAESHGDSIDFSVRMRVLGKLEEHSRVPYAVGESMIERFRHIGLRSAARNAPLDGEADITIPGTGRFDLRLSLIPLRYGSMLTVRLLKQERDDLQSVKTLYPTTHSAIAERIATAVAANAGIILVAGRTGDGKSSTLASVLREATRKDRKVVTIEHPVETLIPGTCQIPVTKAAGFASLLRAVLRADPDIIMVGEIRDAETAQVAMEASQTGHLLMSTVHARNALAAFDRVAHMTTSDAKVGPVSSLITEGQLLLSQRLVRSLCRHCSTHGEPVGCLQCQDGWAQRLAVGETLQITASVRSVLSECLQEGREFMHARDEICRLGAYQPFQLHAEALLEARVTTREELQRVLGSEVDL